MDVTPTPQFTAWLYASVRAHPGWRLVFDSGGVDVKQVDPKAPDLLTVMHQFARDDPERMARFEMRAARRVEEGRCAGQGAYPRPSRMTQTSPAIGARLPGLNRRTQMNAPYLPAKARAAWTVSPFLNRVFGICFLRRPVSNQRLIIQVVGGAAGGVPLRAPTVGKRVQVRDGRAIKFCEFDVLFEKLDPVDEFVREVEEVCIGISHGGFSYWHTRAALPQFLG